MLEGLFSRVIYEGSLAVILHRAKDGGSSSHLGNVGQALSHNRIVGVGPDPCTKRQLTRQGLVRGRVYMGVGTKGVGSDPCTKKKNSRPLTRQGLGEREGIYAW